MSLLSLSNQRINVKGPLTKTSGSLVVAKQRVLRLGIKTIASFAASGWAVSLFYPDVSCSKLQLKLTRDRNSLLLTLRGIGLVNEGTAPADC